MLLPTVLALSLLVSPTAELTGGSASTPIRAGAPVSSPTPRAATSTGPPTARQGSVPPSTAPGRAASRGPWRSPTTSPPGVVRVFAAPPQDWMPGHRGVDLRAPAGTAVRAPADGVVVYVGTIAGRGVLSIDHADPMDPRAVVRTTYEPVAAAVRRGDRVASGQVVASVAGADHCVGGCLHWGARRGHTYVDPLQFLRTRMRLWTPHAPAGHG